MAICEQCNKDMLDPDVESCVKYPIKFPDNNLLMPDTSYYDYNKRCHDCGIENKPGNVHHPGCDIERCPKCKGQLISCGCLSEEYEEELYKMPLEELRKLVYKETKLHEE